MLGILLASITHLLYEAPSLVDLHLVYESISDSIFLHVQDAQLAALHDGIVVQTMAQDLARTWHRTLQTPSGPFALFSAKYLHQESLLTQSAIIVSVTH